MLLACMARLCHICIYIYSIYIILCVCVCHVWTPAAEDGLWTAVAANSCRLLSRCNWFCLGYFTVASTKANKVTWIYQGTSRYQGISEISSGFCSNSRWRLSHEGVVWLHRDERREISRNGLQFAQFLFLYHLVMTNIAMENDPFIDGLPIIIAWWFSMANC